MRISATISELAKIYGVIGEKLKLNHGGGTAQIEPSKQLWWSMQI